MDTNTPAHEAETAATGLTEILDGPSSPAPVEQPKTEAQAPATDAAPEAKPEISEDDPKHPFWYRKQIEKERKAKQALEREVEQLRTQAPAAQPQTFNTPEAYFEHQQTVLRLEMSEGRFVDKHGEQEFDAVKEWLTTRPDIEQWAIQQRHPWGAAFQQYQREKLSAEIGDDPNAWREKERARLREELQAEFAATAPMAQPRPTIPAPASAQRSTGPRSGPAFSGPTPIGDILGG